MITFWIICALLVLLALWFVLPAFLQSGDSAKKDDRRAANLLVYQDQFHELETDLKNGLIAQEQFQQEKDELERRLLDDVQTAGAEFAATPSTTARKFGFGVSAAIPIAAVVLYLIVGSPRGLAPAAASSQAPGDSGQPAMRSQQQIEDNVNKLAQKLEQNPNDAQGWLMLARSYMTLDRYADAADAFGRSIAVNNKDANVWADYAEALAMANDRRLAGKPAEALTRALQLDPNNQKALDLAGSAAYQAGDYQKAIDYWRTLLKVLPPGSEELRTISDQIAKAKELLGDKGSQK